MPAVYQSRIESSIQRKRSSRRPDSIAAQAMKKATLSEILGSIRIPFHLSDIVFDQHLRVRSNKLSGPECSGLPSVMDTLCTWMLVSRPNPFAGCVLEKHRACALPPGTPVHTSRCAVSILPSRKRKSHLDRGRREPPDSGEGIRAGHRPSLAPPPTIRTFSASNSPSYKYSGYRSAIPPFPTALLRPNSFQLSRFGTHHNTFLAPPTTRQFGYSLAHTDYSNWAQLVHSCFLLWAITARLVSTEKWCVQPQIYVSYPKSEP